MIPTATAMVRRWLKWLNPLNHVGISITGKVISSYGLCRFYCRHLVLLLISLLRISVDCTIVFPPPSIAIGIVSIYQFCSGGGGGGGGYHHPPSSLWNDPKH